MPAAVLASVSSPFQITASPAGSANPGATLLQIYLGECLLGALSGHATRADECPLHRGDLRPCDANTLGRPERDEPFVTG